MRGGHSGMEINEGRGNANKTLIRILLPVLRDLKGMLVSIEGGNLRNAIPREAVAKVAVPSAKVEAFNAIVDKVLAETKNEIDLIDPAVEIFAKPATAKTVMSGNNALKMVKAVYACANAVYKMSLSMPGMVETSSNLAIIKSHAGKIDVHCLLRSAIDSSKEDLAETIRAAFELGGAKVIMAGAYSGWQPNMKSPILNEMKKVYKNLFKKDAKVMAIHAGLECGILGATYPNWDMVSFGPTICSPHSPDERVLVSSIDKLWELVVETLKEAPKK